MSSQRASAPERGDAASVVVVDYGLGNLRSVTRGLERAGASVEVSDDPERFESADGVVLPGVGAFREGVENAGPYREPLLDVAESGTPVFGICLGMQMLLTTSEEAERAGSEDGRGDGEERDRVDDGKRDRGDGKRDGGGDRKRDGGGGGSDERSRGNAGDVRGLDLIPGTNVRFAEGQKVPHMGWNRLTVQRDHPLVTGVEEGASTNDRLAGSIDGEYAYFVHSYYAVPDDDAATVATSDYEVTFPAVVANESGTVFGTQFHPEKSGETGLKILRNFVDVCRR